MGTARKLKPSPLINSREIDSKQNEEDKRYIQQYKAKIEELLKEPANQKKAAEIIHFMINKK